MVKKDMCIFFNNVVLLLGVLIFTSLSAQFSVMTHEKTYDLDPTFIESKKNYFNCLNEEPIKNFFEPEFLRDKDKLCGAWECEEGFQAGWVDLHNGIKIPYSYIDRDSDTLLMIGPGLPVPHQMMIPYLKLFPEYDIITFDYRGQGFYASYPASIPVNQWFGYFLYKIFTIDLQVTKLGQVEVQEVLAVVEHAKTFKHYKKIFGLAQCYSASIFVQAAIQQPELFDKIILDGCWPSLPDVVRKIAQYPSLICSARDHHSWIPWLTEREWFQHGAQKLTELVVGIKFEEIAKLEELLPQLTCPLLFFQGRNDVYCSMDEFEKIFAQAPKNSLAALTDFPHGRNYLWGKELFAWLGNAFLSQGYEKTLSIIVSNSQ